MAVINLINPYRFPTAPPGGGSQPSLIAVGTGTITSASDAVGGFSSYTPALNDFILLVSSTQTTMAITADVSGWVNILGTGGEYNVGSALGTSYLYHWVDAGEVSAVTQIYTCAAIYSPSTETGYTHAFAVRGVSTSNPIDHIANFSEATAVTPHATPVLPGASLSNNSLVIVGTARDGASGSGYGTQNPTGFTQQLSTATNNDRWSGTYNSPTTAGVDVPSVNLTPLAADEYASWAIALAAI